MGLRTSRRSQVTGKTASRRPATRSAAVSISWNCPSRTTTDRGPRRRTGRRVVRGGGQRVARRGPDPPVELEVVGDQVCGRRIRPDAIEQGAQAFAFLGGNALRRHRGRGGFEDGPYLEELEQ